MVLPVLRKQFSLKRCGSTPLLLLRDLLTESLIKGLFAVACYRLYEPDIRRIETFLESVAGKLAGKDERAGVKMAFSLFKAALESGDGKVQLRTLQSRLGQKFDSTLGPNVAKALVDWNVFAKGEGVWAWHLHAPRIKHALAVVLEDKSGPDDLK